MQRERALLAERLDFRQRSQPRGFPVGMFRRMFLKPFFVQRNEIELIGSRKPAVEPVLIHKVAKTSVGNRSLYQFVIPGLWKIAQRGRCNVTDVNLMGRVGRDRTEASTLVLQLLLKCGIRPNLSRWFGPITDEIRHVSQ